MYPARCTLNVAFLSILHLVQSTENTQKCLRIPQWIKFSVVRILFELTSRRSARIRQGVHLTSDYIKRCQLYLPIIGSNPVNSLFLGCYFLKTVVIHIFRYTNTGLSILFLFYLICWTQVSFGGVNGAPHFGLAWLFPWVLTPGWISRTDTC